VCGNSSPKRRKRFADSNVIGRIRQTSPSRDPLVDEGQATRMGLLKWAIPDSDCADRFSRYEATIERAFDRVLAQLEQLQRIRSSQKTIDVVHQMKPSD
jgi:hypothetical protein